MVVSCQTYLSAVAEAADQKAEIFKWAGDLSRERMIGDHVLVATYARPEKTKSGIFMPGSIQKEDEYQGCIGLILATGPSAFVYDGQYRLVEPIEGESEEDYQARRAASVPTVGDWVLYRPANGHGIALGQVACRVFKSECFEMIVSDPSKYY